MGAKVIGHKSWGLAPQFENIPEILTKQKRWVCWRAKVKGGGKVGKQPVQPNGRMASSRDPSTWATFEACREAYEAQPGALSGVGFVITGSKKPITIIDLDKCYDPIDGAEPWAQEIITRCGDTYVEVSPSDRGLRVIMFGDAGALTNHPDRIEVYTQESTRYLTITGHLLRGKHDIKQLEDDKLARYLDKYRTYHDPSEFKDEPVSDTPEEIEQILHQLFRKDHDLEQYQPWLDVGMALHHQFNGEWEGCDIWDRASQHLQEYDHEEFEAKWDSFGKGGGRPMTLRTIFARARDLGIKIKPLLKPASADDFADIPDLDHEEVIAEHGDDHPDWEVVKSEPAKQSKSTKAWRGLDNMAETEPPRQLIEDLLAMHQVSQISGPPGAGKTFVAMELCKAVASGESVFGMATKAGPVLYLAYEGVVAMEQRVRAWQANGERLPDNFYVISDDLVPLSDPQVWAKWINPIRAELRPVLIVIDTMAAALPGVSTNDEERVGQIQGTLRNLAKRQDIHVMTIHHPPKGGVTTGQKSRGSGIIEGDLDTQLWVTPTEGKARQWEVSKQRSLGSLGHERRFIIKTIKTGMHTDFGPEFAPYLSVDVTQEDSYAPDLIELQRMIERAIAEHGGTWIDAGQYKVVLEAWLQEHHSGASKDMVKEHRKRAKHHLVIACDVDENPNNHHVRRVANKGDGEW